MISTIKLDQNQPLKPPFTNSWFPANLAGLNCRFEPQSPTDLLRWGLAALGEDVVLATGFGLSGIVLMHLVSQIRPGTTVFYLQTDLHFDETMALKERLARLLPLRFEEVHSGLSLSDQAGRYGPELWRSDPDFCCRLRKVNPLHAYLADKRGWITGIRRDQSPSRAHSPKISWDQANGLLKLVPLADWSRQNVDDYIRRHNLPYNPLHDRGYPSIGCTVCTRKVKKGESERAGRWAGVSKTECGIHIQPDGTIKRVTA
ncbi:MAG: phosphoadenylyl-sulfate reductase [Ardenticatenaceae bacterium]|nr:phosphoadenylyl-sulfate reductase [Ardenticatenaceae bacterium]